MTDSAIQQLLSLLSAQLLSQRQQAPQPEQIDNGKQLLIVDENFLSADIDMLAARLHNPEQVTLISNRYDLAARCHARGLQCQFGDFDFSAIDGELDNVFFRVAKEKAVNNHLINNAARLLKKNGCLHITGTKQEGTKNLIKNAAALFGDDVSANKQGSDYSATITKHQLAETALNDQQYTLIRPIKKVTNEQIFSKPGLFGWNKVDQGSALLAEFFAEFFAGFTTQPSAILDLGCGYGYLSIKAFQAAKASQDTGVSKTTPVQITATDNNAAAVLCCQRNFATFGIQGEVVADNCAASIAEKFDAVISHPPFHKGFKTDSDLGRHFVESAFARLQSGGKALMVANSFVPLEKLAGKVFGHTETLINNQQFKVVAMVKS